MILQTLMHGCILKDWKNKSISFDKFFNQIKTYLSENDYYNSEDKISEHDLRTRKRLNLVQIINKSLKIHEIATNLDPPLEILSEEN